MQNRRQAGQSSLARESNDVSLGPGAVKQRCPPDSRSATGLGGIERAESLADDEVGASLRRVLGLAFGSTCLR